MTLPKLIDRLEKADGPDPITRLWFTGDDYPDSSPKALKAREEAFAAQEEVEEAEGAER